MSLSVNYIPFHVYILQLVVLAICLFAEQEELPTANSRFGRSKKRVQFPNDGSEKEWGDGSHIHQPRIPTRTKKLASRGKAKAEDSYSNTMRKWTAAHDQTLLNARNNGMEWEAIQERQFPDKTFMVLRGKHSRLVLETTRTKKEPLEELGSRMQIG